MTAFRVLSIPNSAVTKKRQLRLGKEAHRRSTPSSTQSGIFRRDRDTIRVVTIALEKSKQGWGSSLFDRAPGRIQATPEPAQYLQSTRIKAESTLRQIFQIQIVQVLIARRHHRPRNAESETITLFGCPQTHAWADRSARWPSEGKLSAGRPRPIAAAPARKDSTLDNKCETSALLRYLWGPALFVRSALAKGSCIWRVCPDGAVLFAHCRSSIFSRLGRSHRRRPALETSALRSAAPGGQLRRRLRKAMGAQSLSALQKRKQRIGTHPPGGETYWAGRFSR